MPQRMYRLNSKKLCLIYLDILGFEKRAKDEAILSRSPVEEVREKYIKKVESCLMNYQHEIYDSEKVSLDSWILFIEDIYNSIEIICRIAIETKLPFEIVIEIKEFCESSDLILNDCTIQFLKEATTNLTTVKKVFKRAYGESPKQTFIILMKNAYNSLQNEKINCKFSNESYCVISINELKKLARSKLGHTTKRKISLQITEQQYLLLETLVASGEYISIDEAIRDAIRRFISNKKN